MGDIGTSQLVYDCDMSESFQHDSAFDPQSSYNFEEQDLINGLGESLDCLHGFCDEGRTVFGSVNHFGDLRMDHTDSVGGIPSQGMLGTGSDSLFNGESESSPDMAGNWQASNLSPGGNLSDTAVPTPPSGQGDIVRNRSGIVDQHFGQVTPPSEPPQELANFPPANRKKWHRLAEDDAQKQRQERARNAAQMRHAKNKAPKGVSKAGQQGEGNGDGVNEDLEDKREKYREKNRLAAAKCRSKKKININDLEDRHRGMAAENNFRKREERELRDELTTLRTIALEHGPDRCNCTDLHHYNQAKATEMALGHRIGGPAPGCMSPSVGHVSAAASPMSDSFPILTGQAYSTNDSNTRFEY